jgi:hypothetical protein
VMLDFRVGYASMRNVPMLGNYLFTCFVCFSPYFILYKRDPMYRSYPSVCLPLLSSSPRQTLINVVDLISTPKALINMSWLMMPIFIDVRGLFVSCQDLGDTKGRFATYLEAHDQTTHAQPDFPLCVRIRGCPKKI